MSRQKTLSITLAVALLVPVILVLTMETAPLASASPGSENWWNSNWARRKPITINNGGSALADYQVPLTVDTATLISDNKMQSQGQDIRFFDNRWKYSKPITINNSSGSAQTDYQILVLTDTQALVSALKMRSDGADIRFKDSDNRTDLSFWIEPGTINTTYTRIWVKIPSVPDHASKTIYMYYGNPLSATSASNENAVSFMFFDDFLGSSLNTSVWSSSGAVSVSSSTVYLNRSGSDAKLWTTSAIASSKPIAVEVKYKHPSINRNRLYLATSANGGSPTGFDYGLFSSGSNCIWWNGSQPNTPMSSNTWYIVKWISTASNYQWKIIYYTTGLDYKSYVQNTSYNANYLTFQGTESDSSDFYLDWILVHKYADPEPQVTVGSEAAADGFELSYLIASGINTTETKIWVRMPSVPAGAGNIYMYYGNSSATSASSESATFIRVIDGAQPLKGSWSMDEGAGTTTADNSGLNNYGTRVGGTSWVAGKFGNALNFNNSSGTYVQMPENDGDFDMTTGITVAAWVNITALPPSGGGSDEIVFKNGAYWLRVDPANETNKFSWFIYSGGVWEPPTRCNWNVVPTTSTWYHVVGTYDGTNMKLYVNGVLRDTRARGTIATSNDPVKIGPNFNGKIDEVAILNRALSADEILDLYNFYGYATPDYPGRILVRRYASTEPTFVVGSEDRGPKPVLISPGNGIATDDSTPTFTWEGSAVDHRLLVDNDNTFDSPQVDQVITPPTTTYTVPDGNSLADGVYYWKVVASVAGDNESEVWWFRVDTSFPATPSLISPAIDNVTDNATMMFQWSNVGDVKQYELWVDNNDDFSIPEIMENVSGTSQENTLAAGGTYYWKVRAWSWVDVPGFWSETRKFTMENFALGTSVDYIMIARGTNESITVSVELTLGVPSTVSLVAGWVDNTPSGVTPHLVPASETMPFESTLTFTTVGSATTGTFIYHITATSANGIERTSDVTVSITTMIFYVGVSSNTATLMRSDTAPLDVFVEFENGEPENVSFSGSWFGESTPDDVSPSFDPPSGRPELDSPFESVLTFATGPNATDGSFVYQIKGTAEGGASRTVNVTVNIFTAITATVATDNDTYKKGQVITISGTAIDPENDLVVSGQATISIACGQWRRTVTSAIVGGAYSASYSTALNNPDGTWTISVSARDSYGNETPAPVSATITVEYPDAYRYYQVTFSSPIVGQTFSRGQAVAVTVQVKENNNDISGANVVLITSMGDNVRLTESAVGVYSAAYTLPWNTPTGSLDMSVICEKEDGGVFKGGTNLTIVQITSTTLVLRLVSPTKPEFEAWETVVVKVRARYSDGSAVEGIVVVNTPSGENLTLTAEGDGIYGATYTIRDDEVGTWDIRISATDAYGNSGLVVWDSAVVVPPGAVGYVIRYWPVVLAAILGLVVASAVVAHGHMRTRRLGAIKREKQQLEKLKKEVAVDYFRKGEISRETYDKLTKEYASKLTNLDKEERLLIDKMKKKLAEKKHSEKKGR